MLQLPLWISRPLLSASRGLQENGWTLLNGHGAKEVMSCEKQPSGHAEPGDDQAHAEEDLEQDRCCPGRCSSYPSRRCCLTLHCTLLCILLWASFTCSAPMGAARVTNRPEAVHAFGSAHMRAMSFMMPCAFTSCTSSL